jgi:hypothetical protein
MSTREEIWQELKLDRKFVRTRHCLAEDQIVRQILADFKDESRKGFGSKDYLGRDFDENCELLVIPAFSYRMLAKKLETVDLQTAVPDIVDQMHCVLKSGEVISSVEVREINPNHERYDKKASKPRKQYGCFAYRDISAGTILGQYIGVIKIELWDSDIEQHSSEFAFALVEHRLGELFVDAKNFGNEMAFVNDGHPDKSRNNVCYLQVSVNGVPAIFVLALRNIARGEELLTKYGKRFWSGRQRSFAPPASSPMASASAAAAASAAAGSRSLRAKRPARGFFQDPSDAGGAASLPSRLEFLREWQALKEKECDGQVRILNLPPPSSLSLSCSRRKIVMGKCVIGNLGAVCHRTPPVILISPSVCLSLSLSLSL